MISLRLSVERPAGANRVRSTRGEKADRERRKTVFVQAAGHRSAHGFDEVSNDVETESGPDSRGRLVTAPEKRSKHLDVVEEPETLVGNIDLDVFAGWSHAERDGPSVWGILDGIVDQVSQCVVQRGAIGSGPNVVRAVETHMVCGNEGEALAVVRSNS